MAKDRISRKLQLKSVKFNSRGKKHFQPPKIHDVLIGIGNAATTVGTRHYEHKLGDEEGYINCFMNNFREEKNGVVLFEFCTYIPGLVLPQLKPDMSAVNAEHSYNPIQSGDDDSAAELVHVAEVLAFGNVMIVESVKGMGGISLLARYVSEMAKRHIDEKHHTFKLLDLVSDDLKKQIESAGGVESISLRLVQSNHSDFKYSNILSPVRNHIPNTSVVSINWESKGASPLGENEVIQAFEEAQDDDPDIEGLFIKFCDGSTLSGLSKYKVRKPVRVDDIGGKNPNRQQIRSELRTYLLELMTPDRNGTKTIDQYGNYVRHSS